MGESGHSGEQECALPDAAAKFLLAKYEERKYASHFFGKKPSEDSAVPKFISPY